MDIIKNPNTYTTSGYARWKYLRLRAGRLGITPQELASCHDVIVLKALARRKFREFARQTHPDSTEHIKTLRGRKRTGVEFQRAHATYKWLMGLTQRQLDQALICRQSVVEAHLPIDWDGWEAYEPRYSGFQIGRW